MHRKPAVPPSSAKRRILSSIANVPQSPQKGQPRTPHPAGSKEKVKKQKQAFSTTARRAQSEDEDDDQEEQDDEVVRDDEDDEDTQAGMKRKRTSVKKAAEMAQIAASLSEEDLEELQRIGRIYGRLYVPFSALDVVMHWGATAEEHGTETMNQTQLRYVQEWNTLVEAYPNLRDLINRLGKQFVVEKLHRYRRDTRGEDVQRIKDDIMRWRKWVPAFTVDDAADKTQRGLNHAQMGELLLPVTHTGPLPNPGYKFSSQVTPRFLYPDDDPNETRGPGLFKGSLVVQGAQAILLGPKAAIHGPHRPATKSVTAIYKIKFITFVFLAYVACIVRYALSGEAEYTPYGQHGFNYVRFYKHLGNLVTNIDALGRAGQDIMAGILEWCEAQIWGDDHTLEDELDEAVPNDSKAILAKYREWIAAQAAQAAQAQ